MVINFTSASYGLKIHTLIFPKISELMVRLLSGESRMFEILGRGAHMKVNISVILGAKSKHFEIFCHKKKDGTEGASLLNPLLFVMHLCD